MGLSDGFVGDLLSDTISIMISLHCSAVTRKDKGKKKKVNNFNIFRIQGCKYIGLKGKHLYVGSRIKFSIPSVCLTLLLNNISFIK